MAEHYLDNLSTPELRDAAYAEAELFALPADWQEGRDVREAYAIDKPVSPDIDDAISITQDEDGNETLHVSIADLGAFLSQQAAIRGYARRRAWTFYKYDGSVAVPMIPRAISEDALSLLDNELRPVITVNIPVGPEGVRGVVTVSREAMHTKRIGFAEVDELLLEGDTTDSTIALRGLARVAHNLRAAREATASDDPELEFSEEPENEWMDASADFNTSHFIVQETMIAANSAMATYMHAHDIPALYRNDVVPSDMFPEITDPQERQELLGLFSRASWATTPEGHFHLRLPKYMHFTSPIRRFADFANHCNLAAYLDGRPFPYRQDRLDRIAARMNELELRERLALQEQRTVRHRRGRPIPQIDELLAKMENNQAHPGDLTMAMFGGAVGNPEALADARTKAAHYVAQHIQLARSILGVAMARKALTLRPAHGEDPISQSRLVIEDNAGNVFPYELEHGKVARAMAETLLLGRIVGVEVTPNVPERLTPRGKILWEGDKYLRKLHRERRIWYASRTEPISKSSYTVDAYAEVGVGTKLHTRKVRGRRNTAMRQATRELIEELDLIDNPPPQRRKPIKGPPQQPASQGSTARRAEAFANPRIALHARMTTAGCKAPEFSFDSPDECVASVIDADGTLYTVTIPGKDDKATRNRASAALLAQLPPRPLNKRGDMWGGPAGLEATEETAQ